MKLRIPLVLLSALAGLAIPAGSAFASPVAVFVSPGDGATISQNQTLSVDTTNVPAAVGVDFYVDNAGSPGMYIGGYTAFASDPAGAQAVNYSSNGNVDSYQLAIGGWALPSDPNDHTTPYPLTFDAVLLDVNGQAIGTMLSKTATIDNTQTPLVRGSFNPSSTGTYAGTIHLTLQPSDQNNVITAGSFSVDSGVTTYPLTNNGGFWSAPVDTVALGVPNGALDIRVHFDDAAGNVSDTDIFYTIANPVAPTITPNTLVADKAQFRTDETQLEVGDVVQAYGMQADGTPAPTIHYLWNICSGPNGQTCTGVTPGPDGSYTVQAADVGATLTLIATASNGVGRPDFTTVDFGVIAPAYVAPVDAPPADTPPAPTPEPPVVTPPVVTPPVVTPPVVTPPVVTPAEQQVIKVAQQVVQTKTKAVVTAQKAAKSADLVVEAVQKKVAAAVNAVSAGTATPAAKQQLLSTVTKLVSAQHVAAEKVATVKTGAVKATVAMNVAVQKAKTAQANVVAAQTAVSTGAATSGEKTHLAKTKQTLVATKATASAKAIEVAAATKQLAVTLTTAAQSISNAQNKVATALTAVASSTATSTAKKTLIEVETKLVTAKAVASAKTDVLQASTTQLAAAKQKLAGKQAAALKP